MIAASLAHFRPVWPVLGSYAAHSPGCISACFLLVFGSRAQIGSDQLTTPRVAGGPVARSVLPRRQRSV